jgi:hypothetical protein
LYVLSMCVALPMMSNSASYPLAARGRRYNTF